jgi:mono/diheme cytochrome c family protein
MKTKFKVGAVVLLLLVVGAVSLFFYARGRGFSAREQPSGLETFMARSARKLATPASAATLKNPEPMTEENAREAREHFIEHCAVCHGIDGRGETTFGRNMYPKVPNLAAGETQQLSDGELFYIISNGIRLSGMPAFGGEDSQQSMWHLVCHSSLLKLMSGHIL